MNDQNSSDAATLFHDALGLPAEERDGFLHRVCAGDSELLEEVRSLLRAHEAVGDTLDPSAAKADLAAAIRALDEFPVGTRVGSYTIRSLIATGGMGAVYLAERSDAEYEKQVAIKLLRSALVAEVMLDRFRTERQVLASLDHPNIARLLDGGATEEGVPYIVMEYVDGRPIDEHCHTAALSTRECLELFRAVCAAVSSAHRNLIVHRDLKPSNILVDRSGHVKLLDFGLAKILDPSDVAEQAVTRLRMLTPRYASPEQIRGERVTPATDVYSLGVVLYEILTGCSPYEVSEVDTWKLDRAICEDTPPRASARLPSGAAWESRSARQRRRRLRGDVDTILTKALRKDPNDRYRSADELGEDIRRHLDGSTVTARPDTFRYRTRVFVRKQRALVTSVVGIVLALAVGLVVALTQYSRAQQQAETARRLAYSASIAAAEKAILANQLDSAERALNDAPPSLRGWEWDHLYGRLDGSYATWHGHDHWVTALAVSPDGARLASGSYDGTVKIWDLEDSSHIRTLRRDDAETWAHGVLSLDFAPDGRHILVGYVEPTSAHPEGVVLWNVETAEAIDGAPDMLWSEVTVDGAGEYAAVGVLDGRVYVSPLSDLSSPVAVIQPSQVGLDGEDGVAPFHVRLHGVAFQPGGDLLATARQTIELWDTTTWTRVSAWPQMGRGVEAVSFSPDGGRLAAIVREGPVIIREIASGNVVAALPGDVGGVNDLAFSPSGDEVFSVSDDGRVLAWSVAGGSLTRILRGHRTPVRALALTPDGGTVISGDDRGDLRMWNVGATDIPTWRASRKWRPTWPICVTFTPDGGSVVAAHDGDLPGVWDIGAGSDGRQIPGVEPIDCRALAFAHDGDHLVAALLHGVVSVSSHRRGAPVHCFQADPEQVLVVATHPTEDLYVTAGSEPLVRIWTLGSMDPAADPLPHPSLVTAALFTPDGSRLVTGTDDGRVFSWPCSGWHPAEMLDSHAAAVVDVAATPDGATLAVAYADGAVRVLPCTGADRSDTVIDGRSVTSVGFSSDGSRLFLGSTTGVLHILDGTSLTEIVQVDAHANRIVDMDCSRDGSLVSASRDGTVKIWDRHPRGRTSESTRAPERSSTENDDGARPPARSLPDAIDSAHGTLVAQWNATRGASDVIGSHDGRLENGASVRVEGTGHVFSLEGPTAVLRVDDVPDCLVDAQSFTILGWFGPGAQDGSQTLLAHERGNRLSGSGWSLSIGLTTLTLTLRHPFAAGGFTTTYRQFAVEAQLLSRARHIGVAFHSDTRSVSFFLDGALLGRAPLPDQSAIDPDAPLLVGRDAFKTLRPLEHFDGTIDDVRVYCGSLSVEEVQAIFSEGPS